MVNFGTTVNVSNLLHRSDFTDTGLLLKIVSQLSHVQEILPSMSSEKAEWKRRGRGEIKETHGAGYFYFYYDQVPKEKPFKRGLFGILV